MRPEADSLREKIVCESAFELNRLNRILEDEEEDEEQLKRTTGSPYC